MRCYRETFEQIWSAFSGQAALQTVSDLSRFHRIQASPGHRQAAELDKSTNVGSGTARSDPARRRSTRGRSARCR